VQAIAAAYNFFINGMAAGLIYHKAGYVPTASVSIAVDLPIACLSAFVISMPFSRASLRRNKTGCSLGGSATGPPFGAAFPAPCATVRLLRLGGDASRVHCGGADFIPSGCGRRPVLSLCCA